MEKRARQSRVLGAGLLAGALLYFLCYWWLGSIAISATVALGVATLVALDGGSGRRAA